MTKAPCRNGFVLPVGWDRIPPAVTGRCCCCVGWAGWAAPKFFANGFVPVCMGCMGWGDTAGCCCGGWDWNGEFEAGTPNGWAAWGDERANGLLDWLVAGRCWVFVGAGACAKGEPVCWFMSIDWRKGFVVCCGA